MFFFVSNLLGFIWALIASVFGIAVSMLLGHPPGTTNVVAIGFTMFVCDFAYRFLQGDPIELMQLLRLRDGGYFMLIPCWIIGLLLCIAGLLR